MTVRTLTCRELIEFLGQYLDAELPADERTVFDAHLSICPDCRNYLASYRETIRLGKRACAPADETSPDAPQELIAAILAARNRR
jgi:anti-sigma factor RsiW